MPTNLRHRGQRRRHGGFDEDALQILCTGLNFFGYGGLAVGSPEEKAAMFADWKRYGREITAAHVRVHPGRRCWAWWEFSAPEPRRRVKVGGVVVMPDSMTALIGPEYPLSFGLPRAWIYAPSDVPNVFETEREYLARLRLRTASELENTYGR